MPDKKYTQDAFDTLINKGARLKTPDGDYLLFAAHFENFRKKYYSTLLLRDITSPYSYLISYPALIFDFDKKTEKLYLAYSSSDYIQALPLALHDLASYRQLLEKEYLELSGTIIPQEARAQNWPVHENHCIQRILLDHLFQAQWNTVLKKKNKAAYQQLNNQQLGQLLWHTHQLWITGKDTCQQWNKKSLSFRRY